MAAATKTKHFAAIGAGITILLVVFFGLTNYGRYLLLRPYDAIQLRSFAHQIASADSATATVLADSVHLTFTGAELEKILLGVSSGRTSRMPDAVFMSSAFATVTFHRGTNSLGGMNLSEQLFSIRGGGQYFDKSGLLNQTIYTPLRQKLRGSYVPGEAIADAATKVDN